MRLPLALFATHHDKRTFRVLAWYVRQERTRQKSTKQHRCPCERGDADECAEHQRHQHNIGDVVVPRKVVLDVSPENRGEEVLCNNWGDNCHAD